MTKGTHSTYDDGSRIKAAEIEGGYYRVTFSLPDPDRKGGWLEETCEACPCLSVCSHERKCVKDSAHATDR